MNTKRLQKLFTCNGKRKLTDTQERALQYLNTITLYHPYHDSAIYLDSMTDDMDKFGLGDVDKIFDLNIILCHLKMLETGTFWGHALDDCLPDCFHYHNQTLPEDLLFANVYSWWKYRTTLNKTLFDVVNFDGLAKQEDESTAYAKYLPENINGVDSTYLKAATRLISGKNIEVQVHKYADNSNAAIMEITYPTSMVRTYLMTKMNHLMCADYTTKKLQDAVANLPDHLLGADFRTVLEYLQSKKLI